nr:MAG TPA: hypothetical protein [Caudoviricetes sp.]
MILHSFFLRLMRSKTFNIHIIYHYFRFYNSFTLKRKELLLIILT